MIVDQFLSVLPPHGDGIADSARAIRDSLRQAGHRSEIYVNHVLSETADQCRHLRNYPFPKNGIRLVHYTDTSLVDFVVKHRLPIRLLYHNITPAEFFVGYDESTRTLLECARTRLHELIPFTRCAASNSEYSRMELQQLGFPNTFTFMFNIWRPFENIMPDPKVVQALDDQPFLLFVGRLAPNKRHADLIALLWLYRQLNPRCELYLVGRAIEGPYMQFLRQRIIELELEPYVHMTGHVTPSELVAYYQKASVFVSMSEHEGFGLPLVESMLHGVPVVAYASTAVTEVVHSAGILIRHKRLEEWAIVIDRLMEDNALRQQVLTAQNLRVDSYSVKRWEQALEGLLFQN